MCIRDSPKYFNLSPLTEKVGKFRSRNSRNARSPSRRLQIQLSLEICNHATRQLRLPIGFSANHSISRKIIVRFKPQNIGQPHHVTPAKISWDKLIPNWILCLNNRFPHKNNLLHSIFDLHPNNITSRLWPSTMPRAATAEDPQHTR